MTDKRQGVTPTQHAVLDFPVYHPADQDVDAYVIFIRQMSRSQACVNRAWKLPLDALEPTRTALIEAAARLIDAAERLQQMIDRKDHAK